MNTQTSAQSALQAAIQNNLAARANLIATGVRFRTRNQFPGSVGLGETLSAVVPNTGLITGILALVTVPLVSAAAAGLVQSASGVWEFLQNVTLTDYSNRSRINVNGEVLNRRNAIVYGRPQYSSTNRDLSRPAVSTWFDSVYDSLSGAPANGNYSLVIPVYIPLARDPWSDLSGALLAQTDAGQIQLSITTPASLVAAANAPWTAGAGLSLGAAGITAEFYVDYLMPQAGFGATPLPTIDLATVCEIQAQGFDTSNLAAGSTKYINWPNNRSVLAIYHRIQSGISFDRVRLLANGSTVLRDQGPNALACDYAALTGDVLEPNYVYLGSRRQPISTAVVGTVQTAIDVTEVAGAPGIYTAYEGIYMPGSQLGGVIQ